MKIAEFLKGRPAKVIRPMNLSVDDHVIGWFFSISISDNCSDWEELDTPTNSPYRIVEIVEATGQIIATNVNGRTANFCDLNDNLWLVVVMSKHHTEEFPHDCPACGKAAYVGLLKVEHQSKGDCSAR